jgi:hypothetical protein
MPTGLAVDPCGERFCVPKNRKVIVQTTALSDEREPRDKAASRRGDVLTMGYVIHSPLSGPGPQEGIDLTAYLPAILHGENG